MAKDKKKLQEEENLNTIIEEVKDDDRFSDQSEEDINMAADDIETDIKLDQEEMGELEDNPSNSEKKHKKSNLLPKRKKKPHAEENLKTIIEEVKDDRRFSEQSKEDINIVDDAMKNSRTLTQEEVDVIENNPSKSDTIYRIKNWEKKHRTPKLNDSSIVTDPATVDRTSIHLWERFNLFLSFLNLKIIKIILFCLMLISLIPTFIFLYLQKTLKYLNWMTRHEPQKHLWYAGFDTIIIVSWAIVGMLIILFVLIGIKQLMDLRKENKEHDRSLELVSAWSAIFAILLIPTIVSIVFDSILINKYRKSSEYKSFNKDK